MLDNIEEHSPRQIIQFARARWPVFKGDQHALFGANAVHRLRHVGLFRRKL